MDARAGRAASFDDGALDAVVTTSAFHFFDQPAALREFHRVLAPGGLVAVSALSTRQPRLQVIREFSVEAATQHVRARDADIVRGRRVRHHGSTPDPATGVDGARVRPVDRRHEKLEPAPGGVKHARRHSIQATTPASPIGEAGVLSAIDHSGIHTPKSQKPHWLKPGSQMGVSW